MININIKRSNRCLVCHSDKLTHFLSLGHLPLANSYLTKMELKNPELTFPLDIYFCHICHLVQLLDIVDRNKLFRHYAYYSSASYSLIRHFELYAQDMLKKFPTQTKRLTIDIGCNDGILLKPLKAGGARVLGIDPAKNITSLLSQNNIDVITAFFGTDLVSTIKSRYGKAGVITANNVLAHTDKIHNILDATEQLLAPDGVFVFEVQHVASLVEKNQFDSIYHEHICYYSLQSLIYLLELHGLRIFDVQYVNNHGGSLRVYACLTDGPHQIKKGFQNYLQKELGMQLDSINTYQEFAKQPLHVQKKLSALLTKLKKKGKKIVGYGAPAKATTLLNYCNISHQHIDYIIDTTPAKQNLYLPGNHIPILEPEMLKEKVPDYVILLAWNYADAIIEKEQWFTRQGGKFIIPLPYPSIIE